jgi:hypothetical protein
MWPASKRRRAGRAASRESRRASPITSGRRARGPVPSRRLTTVNGKVVQRGGTDRRREATVLERQRIAWSEHNSTFARLAPVARSARSRACRRTDRSRRPGRRDKPPRQPERPPRRRRREPDRPPAAGAPQAPSSGASRAGVSAHTHPGSVTLPGIHPACDPPGARPAPAHSRPPMLQAVKPKR